MYSMTAAADNVLLQTRNLTVMMTKLRAMQSTTLPLFRRRRRLFLMNSPHSNNNNSSSPPSIPPSPALTVTTPAKSSRTVWVRHRPNRRYSTKEGRVPCQLLECADTPLNAANDARFVQLNRIVWFAKRIEGSQIPNRVPTMKH
jgi:hypothetical protein